MAALRRTDVPILHYDEVRLFDDEVDDHGVVAATVRVRVMDACVFVLARVGIRVDGVLWRVLDTRVYHAFGEGGVVREWTWREGPMEGERPPGGGGWPTVDEVAPRLEIKESRTEVIELGQRGAAPT